MSTPARWKYPRTPHHPDSPGFASDDVTTLSVPDGLAGNWDVVVTLKIDGEATTGYPDGYVHARSLDSAHHESRSWVKQRLAPVLPLLPDGWRICGENVYAVHSIEYTAEHDLPDLFLVYSIWDDTNTCLDWNTTMEWCDLLGLVTVPVIYRGPMPSGKELAALFAPFADRHEGWVVRAGSGFPYDSFDTHVMKWVRSGHVTSTDHWMSQQVRKNWSRHTS